MKLPAWHEEPIAKRHNRALFDCGDGVLNDYLYHYARQSHEQGGAKTVLAISDADNQTVFGFYTLCPSSVEYARVPGVIKRGLARYDVPVFRLGRLAVHLAVQNQGLGGQLLLAAGRRCILAAMEVGGVALLIDAKHERAANWYMRYGAIPLLDALLSLLLPLTTIASALQISGKLQ